MPTYEYECKECKHKWELEQKIVDLPVTICPACKKEQAKRLISGGTSFQLLGGGWYREGYNK
jgi:putative FmdB family regulatory protein